MSEWIFFMHPPRDDFIPTMSEDEARRVVADEPVTAGGHIRAEFRPYRLVLLRGRDG